MSPRSLKLLRRSAAIITVAALVLFATLGYNLSSSYYWLLTSALIPAFAYLALRNAYARAEARDRAGRRWMANPSQVERARHTQFEELLQKYGERTRDDSLGYVDDRTWSDLGMDEVRDQIDVCFTMSGRNELLRILRHALPPISAVQERLRQMTSFQEDQTYREQVAHGLCTIGDERNADPAALLWGDGVSRDRLYPLFVTMALLAVASISVTAAVDLTAGLICILGVFFTNMWIYYRKARHISGCIPALRILSRMIAASARLPGMDEIRRPAKRIRGAFLWLLTGAPSPMLGTGGDIVEMVFLYIKIFFQIDLIAYERIVKHLTANREAYQKLYRAVGSLDAAFSMASHRALRGTTCTAAAAAGDADVSAETVALQLSSVYHPLIENAVPNSVNLKQPGAIVTGTNMAGKSTFLRTVGINVLFAQAMGFAFADSYSGSRMRVFSSIDKHDDLAEGKSFYYDEAERIYRMIEEVEHDDPESDRVAALLLIDELLSGTNSLERESASVAILDYLCEHNALTIAATHDVTIASGVGDRYELYYFGDSADESGLSFTYQIQKGIVKTRNAIKLLRLIGYPESVINKALDRTLGNEDDER